MRKEMMKKIKKELKKENLVGVTFLPTLEECDYLYKNNITTTKSVTKRTPFISDYEYFVDTTDFCIE